MESLGDILRRSNPMATAMVYMLAWLANADGEVSKQELDALRAIARSGSGEASLAPLIKLAARGRLEDLQLACEVIREGGIANPDKRPLLMQMAVGLSLEDGILTAGEGHVLRLLADLLGLSPKKLDAIFREMTGNPLPPVANVSSRRWWQERERTRARSNDSEDRATRRGQDEDLTRLRHLAILGLDESASQHDIKAAYRRMAKMHHPDRFASLGEEAVAAANISFCRIRKAYETLVTQ